jgi:hypothetical protein
MLGSASARVVYCLLLAARKHLLLISGSKVRVLVRPPLKSLIYMGIFRSFTAEAEHDRSRGSKEVPTARRVLMNPVVENPRPAFALMRSLLFIFAFVRRHMTSATVRAIIVALAGPHVSPLVATRRATIKVAEAALTFLFFTHSLRPFWTRESAVRHHRYDSW